MSDEKIMVYPRAVTPNLPLYGLFQDETLLPRALAHMEFGWRSRMETDPAYKQLIPYCMLRHGTRLICYRRSTGGGETRLHGLYSLGWGGHVNSGDQVLPLWNDAIITQTFYRELKEEIDVKINRSPRLVGFINDDTTEVGKVHLGIVFEYWLDEPQFKRHNKQGQEKVAFLELDEIVAAKAGYESWSQIVIDEYLIKKD
jgi:predicted NUDIX family phosphoesterase